MPGVKFDNRTRQFRAEAIWYRTIVEHVRKNKQPYADWRGPTNRPRGGSRSPRKRFRTRSRGSKPGGTSGGRGVVVLPTGTGKTHLANMAIETVGRPTLSSPPPSTS